MAIGIRLQTPGNTVPESKSHHRRNKHFATRSNCRSESEADGGRLAIDQGNTGARSVVEKG